MRYLGLDVGTKTIGVAISDKTGLIASPLKVIRFDDINQGIKEVIQILKEFEIAEIVIGLPKNMDNTEGFASKRSIEFENLLAKETEIQISFIDERLTSVEAEKILINNGLRREKRKKQIDALAAVLILETYLKRKEK